MDPCGRRRTEQKYTATARKAGTIEHVHRVLKSNLGAGVVLSRLFGANAAWLRINTLTFNLLTALKALGASRPLPRGAAQAATIRDLNIAAKLAIHESQLSVHVSAADERLQEMVTARKQMLTMRESVFA